ncbi:pathogenesis-related homeodomain protein isoform X1 [Sesamum indicum]|uniref:Pathogenesis-related homeodomain protein isoform X1 n=1 Tax=Sesamum indicum TaxID=4182 RepID=A0A6I9TR65_SESIN|nr:pathogenesis-related homeodomain protein isoform X1 [Sesamum indicum]XP_011088188.1 pathogenesis-related homeodomain protein isoform X1 [Sesamum indicum]
MGLIKIGTQDPESNMIEPLETSENLAQDPKSGPLTPANYKMDSETLVTETMEKKEVTGSQNFRKNIGSVEEISDQIKETGPNPEDISQNLDAEKEEPPLESAKTLSVAQNLEVISQNGLTNLENMCISPEAASANHGCGKLETVHIDETKNSGQLGTEDRGCSVQSRKRKAGLKSPVTSSWVLRSKSQEKPKAPEPNENVKEDSANGEKKKRGRKKKPMQKTTVNEFSRTKTHLRYLLHRIKYEQSLIDAYSAEGWKGQSLDKLKPEKELQRAKSHILRYKLKIRALIQRLDMSLAVGKLPESLFDSHGEIDSEDIFCAKCGSKDLPLDNDIILCDGACERGFHQFCLEPPLLKEDIPPGDEGWICPGCDCKIDCIDMLKDFQGTKISHTDSWEKIFPEAAAAASGKTLDNGSGSSSDDSDDDDYDPDKPDAVEKVEGDESSSDESNYFSASDDLAASLNNEKYLGLPSDDSEDDDFDPSALDPDKQAEQESSSSDFTSDSEDLGALLDDTEAGEDLGHISPSSYQNQSSTGSKEENVKVGGTKRQSLKDELSYLLETSGEPVSGRRHVERWDYKSLHDETYGNSSSDSSDEDFVDTTAPKRRRIDREKTEVTSPNKTPITENNMKAKDENQKESKHLRERTRKNIGDTIESSSKVGSASTGTKRSANKRLGEAITQRLYASFNENQYPERAVKENLAKELGLKIQQVSKWFENARWSFQHRSRVGSNSDEKPPEPQPTISTDNHSSNQNMELQESSALRAREHITEAKLDNLATNSCKENSGTRDTRKRRAKIDQAPDDIHVDDKTQEQKMLVDMRSPQPCSSKRQTRSSNSVA